MPAIKAPATATVSCKTTIVQPNQQPPPPPATAVPNRWRILSVEEIQVVLQKQKDLKPEIIQL